MSTIKEVLEIVHEIAELVHDTLEFATIVKDAHKYLAREHPEAKSALHEMLNQMRITIVGLGRATAVVSSFRFSRHAQLAPQEEVRFNEHLIDYRKDVAALQGEVRTLKGSCDRIREEHHKLNALGGDSWLGMFRLFGKQRRQREQELTSALSRFYEDDLQMISLVTRVIDIAGAAIFEIDQLLGRAGSSVEANVQDAAILLSERAQALATAGTELATTAAALDEAIAELG